MTTVIQISDFHIKLSMGDPEENTVFTGLVRAISQFQRDGSKIIIVYNGDVIDNTNIYEEIKKLPKGTTSAEKAEFWEKRAEEEYTLAEKYFDYMLSRLSLPAKRLVICCGNHDVNSWYDMNDKRVDCPHSNDRLFSQHRFDRYDAFLKKLRIFESRKSEAYFVKIDDFHFLVANSNWLNKFDCPNGLCIDCKSIKDIIQSRKALLWKNKNACIYKNIFVAHAPISDYCEEARMGYEKNHYSPISDQIDELFGLQLFGDKHTGRAKGAEYIVGAPLDSEKITCVAHQFSDSDTYFYRTLTFTKGGEWEINHTYKYSEKILELSEKYIKDKAKEYLFDSYYPNTMSALNHFELVRANPKWKALNALFKASSRVREPVEKGSGKLLPIGSDYINTLTKLVNESRKKVSITVRGGMRLGKSVCMSVLYLNMLHRFSCGSFDYIPMYVNLETILQEINTPEDNRDSEKYYDKVMEKVIGIFDAGKRLCTEYEYNVCCIIDGLNQYCYYKNAKIDNGIIALLNRKEYACFKRLIYCIDTDYYGSRKGLEYTTPHKNRDAQYVIYFDPILTYKIHTKDRYNGFIDAYCGLNGVSEDETEKCANTIKNNISQMGILEIDTNLMTYCWNHLCTPNNKESYFSLLDKFVQSKLSDVNTEMTRASYMLYFEGRGYSDIKNKCSICNDAFDVIRTQPAIAKYLIAKYYVETVTKYDIGLYPTMKSVPSDSCLNHLMDHEMCTLIRGYIKDNNLSETLFEFTKQYYEYLMPAGRATMVFLVGRQDIKQQDILNLLDSLEKKTRESEIQKREHETVIDNYERVAKRSITVSRMFAIANNANSHDLQRAVLEYVHMLICDENDRAINRRFHLQFYGDRINEESSLNNDRIRDGFDLYCTYHILCQRFKRQIENQEQRRLLSLELFTLCDLIQIRIDNPVAFTSDEEETASFFYNAKYNMPNDSMALSVIKQMTMMVAKYLDMFGNNPDDLFIQYLKHQMDTYDRIQLILNSGPLNRESDCYKPRDIINELRKLESTKRMGWMFPDLHKMIRKSVFMNKLKGDKCYETTLEHVYEMYLMGMLYLPKYSDRSEYDKRIILDLVILHDLGEAYTGDSIKTYEHYKEDKEKEIEWCRSLYLQGVHEGVADLTEYGKLFDQWNDSNKPNYNVIVAKDLDRLQLLYKLSLLLTEDDQRRKVRFSKNRFLDFWSIRQDIQSNEVIRIFNLLIASNQSFVDVVKEKYDVQVATLQERI